MVDDTVPTPHPQLVRRIKRDRRGFRDAGDEPDELSGRPGRVEMRPLRRLAGRAAGTASASAAEAPAFRDETGQEAQPRRQEQRVSTNLPKREKTGKSPRRPVASVAALFGRWPFSPGPGPEAAAAAIPQVGEGQSAANASVPSTLLSSRRRGCPAHKGGNRRPGNTRNGLPGSSPPLPRITTGTTGFAGTTVLNHFTSWDYPSPPARLEADFIRVQRVRAGF